MTTPDVFLNAINAPTSTLHRVRRATITVTRSEPSPAVKVVDETVKHLPAHLKPVDPGKKKIEVVPGLHLWSYSRGYCVLEQKSKGRNGQKVQVRRVLYRDDISALIKALAAAEKACKTYSEAHGITAEAAPAAAWDATPF